MGKVKDEAAASKAAKPGPKGTGSRIPTGISRFFGNLLRTDSYKSTQGWYARIWTAIGLGAVVAAGIYTLHSRLVDETTPSYRFGIPAVIGVGLAWFIYRLIQYPPFADFLIATEAEMNKISWTTWPQLKRATIVVLTTVLLLAVYLFGVDLVWQALLKFIGVLRFTHNGFGSQAG